MEQLLEKLKPVESKLNSLGVPDDADPDELEATIIEAIKQSGDLKMLDEVVLEKMISLAAVLHQCKPEERGDRARYYAVTITEIEKAIAYFSTWIAGQHPE